MFSATKISATTVGVIAIGLGSVAPVSAASLYEITGLSFLPSDINDSAQVVGENYLWEDGNVINLNTLPGANNSNLSARAINNKGAIVGGGLTVNESTVTQSTIPNQSFIYDGSKISGLPRDGICLISCSPNTAEDINDSGTIVLNYDGRDGYVQQSDGTTTLALGGRTLLNIAINNQNQVVGTRISGGGGSVDGLFIGTGRNGNRLIAALVDLKDPNYQRSFGSFANDIDDSSNIVGTSVLVNFSPTLVLATLWTDVNQPGVSLGTLGGNNSSALGINNSQQIVGYSTLTPDGSTQHAFLWENNSLTDLNNLIDPDLGWELTSAFEINNNGDIIGVGTYNGVQQGFIAKAVPEPSSVLGILGLGLFGLGGWLKRQQNKKLIF